MSDKYKKSKTKIKRNSTYFDGLREYYIESVFTFNPAGLRCKEKFANMQNVYPLPGHYVKTLNKMCDLTLDFLKQENLIVPSHTIKYVDHIQSIYSKHGKFLRYEYTTEAVYDDEEEFNVPKPSWYNDSYDLFNFNDEDNNDNEDNNDDLKFKDLKNDLAIHLDSIFNFDF